MGSWCRSSSLQQREWVAVSGAQTGNPGSNAIDGSLATRWSQSEIGATLTADLGAITINITWGNGNHFESVTISNNKFPRSTWGAQYYILRSRDDAGVGVGNFSNNTFEDNGAPVTISNGG